LAKKILVADDDFLIRWSLTEVLSELGYLVKAVENGQKALEAIEAERFDFIITDLIMPGRDGWEILRYAKGTYPETKVVLISAHGTPDTEAMAEKRGAYGYLEKPEILDKITTLLGGHAFRTGDMPSKLL
jgi:DNA-binding NtrC family response regulator